MTISEAMQQVQERVAELKSICEEEGEPIIDESRYWMCQFLENLDITRRPMIVVNNGGFYRTIWEDRDDKLFIGLSFMKEGIISYIVFSGLDDQGKNKSNYGMENHDYVYDLIKKKLKMGDLWK